MKPFALLLVALIAAATLTLAGCPKPDAQSDTATPAFEGEAPGDAQAPTFSAAVTSVDEFAPDFALLDTDGNQVTKADFSGKVLILDFWATTCTSCVKKLGEYTPLVDQYKDKGVEWLAVSLDPKPEVAAAGAADHKWPYRVVMFSDEMKQAYFADEEIISIPQVRIIDRDGNLRYAFGSASTLQDLELALEELVQENVGGDESVSEAVAEGTATEEAAPADPDGPGLPESMDSGGSADAAPPAE